MCADNVVPSNIPCCGMAGDRGMRYPELTAASLQVRRARGRAPRAAAATAAAAAGGVAARQEPAGVRRGSRPPALLLWLPTPTQHPLTYLPHPPSHLPPQHLNVGGCSDGYSTSRTCEMSLSNHSGINFRGLVRAGWLGSGRWGTPPQPHARLPGHPAAAGRAPSCRPALTDHMLLPRHSLHPLVQVYLVDEATKAKQPAAKQ